MNGKGDRNRTIDIITYEKNYEKIFNKPKKEDNKDEAQIRPKWFKKLQTGI
jgi:hypothetical protein